MSNDMSNETKNGRVGYGKVVHKLTIAGFASCGSGNVGVGSRRRSWVTETTDEVTCKKCLAKIAEVAEADTTSTPIAINSLTTGEVETTGRIVLIRRLT